MCVCVHYISMNCCRSPVFQSIIYPTVFYWESLSVLWKVGLCVCVDVCSCVSVCVTAYVSHQLEYDQNVQMRFIHGVAWLTHEIRSIKPLPQVSRLNGRRMRIKNTHSRRGRRRRDGGNKSMGWRERRGINRRGTVGNGRGGGRGPLEVRKNGEKWRRLRIRYENSCNQQSDKQRARLHSIWRDVCYECRMYVNVCADTAAPLILDFKGWYECQYRRRP